MSVKVTEIERTRQSSGSTVIERSTVVYDGSKIVEVAHVLNGAPDGTAKLTYGKNGIERVEYTDKQGDRATDTLTYANGELAKLRHEIPGVLTTEQSYAYFAEDRDTLKEISTTNTPVSGLASSQVSRYEYDSENRIAKITTTAGSTASSTEYRYTADGNLDRATLYSGTTVAETYSFRYLPDGNLDEITDSKNNRFEVTYDKNGKITEIRHTTTSGVITTTRYTYGSGGASGWTFAPELPAGDLFDLGGNSYGTLSMLHGSVPEVGDIPKATTGGGGGTCTGFEPQNACDTCLASSCCTQTKACLQGTVCYSYFECANACTTQTCRDSCGSSNPSGKSAYDSFVSCGNSFCSTQCAGS